MENKKVIIRHINATKAIEYKNQLIERGLVMNVDFTWKYDSAGGREKSHVEFTFTDSRNVTIFTLLWS